MNPRTRVREKPDIDATLNRESKRCMIHRVRVVPIRPGFLAILLLVLIGVGLISPALPDAVADAGCYDGDSDDAAVAPERLAVLSDVAISTDAATLPVVWTFSTVEVPAAPVTPVIVEQSPPPPLRSPPQA
jgi:hypothetical protein